MNGFERLAVCEQELKARGVNDVKLTFGKVSEKPASEVAGSTATVLEYILAGKYTDAKPIGDSKGKK